MKKGVFEMVTEETAFNDVLVIGAGVAGIEASLLLSRAGKKVHLVERGSYTGGSSILFEQVFPTLECSTCMLSPRQQELLQDGNIDLQTLSEVQELVTSPEGFTVKVAKRVRLIDEKACIGCGACFEPCPVSVPNEAEFGLTQRKAVYVPFAGALPNVPVIDLQNCLRSRGTDCQACKDACVFDAVVLDQKEEIKELKVRAIIIAIGSGIFDVGKISKYGYGKLKEVYHALEFERLFSSNGPTGGKIVMRNGQPPSSVALIHCVGREEKGYCSSVCCLYLLKFNHYLRSKLPGVEIHEYFTELNIPGRGNERFFLRMMEGGTELVRINDLQIKEEQGKLRVEFDGTNGKNGKQPVDMVVLAPAIEPREGAVKLAEIFDLRLDEKGFFSEGKDGPISTPRNDIYVIGTAQGPKDIGASVAEAYAAVAEILAKDSGGGS